ncbi:MAG: acetyl-CoA acetyltransferase [Armatimonadetes bacterium CG07_land_8_20_14_0_80_40_9]|nr:MAG: acetyl-CoA acetyltransferase [Armatimonadetes bacterium CG07_land_8_20_14_0_80_40_9]
MSGRRVFVLGGGISKFDKDRVDGTMRDWVVEAVLSALEDAGVDIQDIEHSTTSYFSDHFDKQLKAGAIFQDHIGMCPKPNLRVEGGGATGGLAIRNAYAYIKSGLCDSMIIYGAENMGRHVPSDEAQQFIALASDTDWEVQVAGYYIAYYALMMKAHMEKYGTKEEQFALVSVKNHRNAMYNPNAHGPKEITVDDVMKSRLIAYPYKLYDCSLLSDGAACLIFATEDWAKKHCQGWEKKPTIEFTGTGCGTDFMRLADRPHPYPGVIHFRGKREAAKMAYEMAGIKNPLKDFDCFEVHDAYSGVELVSYEDLGFCKEGESGKLMEEGVFDLGGELPCNTSGGLIGFGHPVGATGIAQGVEILKQLREEVNPKRQVSLNVKRGGMDSHGGTGTFVTVNIFERRD